MKAVRNGRRGHKQALHNIDEIIARVKYFVPAYVCSQQSNRLVSVRLLRLEPILNNTRNQIPPLQPLLETLTSESDVDPKMRRDIFPRDEASSITSASQESTFLIQQYRLFFSHDANPMKVVQCGNLCLRSPAHAVPVDQQHRK